MSNIVPIQNIEAAPIDSVIFNHIIGNDIDIYESLKDLNLYLEKENFRDKVFNDPKYYKYQRYLNLYGLKNISDTMGFYEQDGPRSAHFHFDSFSEYLNTVIKSDNPKITVPILIEIRKNAFYLYYEYPYEGVKFTEQEKCNAPQRNYVKYSSVFYRREDNEFSGTPLTSYIQVKYSNLLIDDFINSKFNNKQSKYII